MAAFFTLNAAVYSLYLGVHAPDWIARWRSGSSFPTSFLMFHLSYGLMWISYFRLIWTPPGSVPADHVWTCRDAGADDETTRFDLRPDEIELMHKISESGFYPFTEPLRDRIRRLPFTELKVSSPGCVRRCAKCVPTHYKPDRTHHCSRTDTTSRWSSCVLVMDHFCVFANTTIGLRNRKFFVLFLAYALATLLLYLGIMANHAGAALPHLLNGVWLRRDAAVLLTCVVVLTIAGGLILFLFFHIYIIMYSMTTIEFREKHQSHDWEVRRRSAIANIKFDGGFRDNLTQVFGTTIWLWPVPVQSVASDTMGLYMDAERLARLHVQDEHDAVTCTA